MINYEFLESNRLSVEEIDGTPTVIFVDPPSDEIHIMLLQVLGAETKFQTVSAERLKHSLQAIRAEQGADEQEQESNPENTEQLKDLASEAPIVKFVNNIIHKAIQSGASDIHIEPMEQDLRIRFRVDGVLREADHAPKAQQAAIISRIKIMAKLDIGEKRLPQDGRIRYQTDSADIDMRVSTLPIASGESLVLRILDKRKTRVTLDKLGLPDDIAAQFRRDIHRPNGLILVTGPTGSGKTTTLYSVLDELNDATRKIITIEDPVEYQLEGINQVQVKSEIGMTFASGLRSILRQDPDIIMIGEIRDRETAQIAVESSLTGHLVLATLHTNDATSSIARLLDMGVESYLLASTLRGVMAQRLVRRLCPVCKTYHDEPVQVALGQQQREIPSQHLSQGCDHCFDTGYKGRIGIYEYLQINNEMTKVINQTPDPSELYRSAVDSGMRSLTENVLDVIQQGETSLDEAIKISSEL